MLRAKQNAENIKIDNKKMLTGKLRQTFLLSKEVQKKCFKEVFRFNE